MITKKRGLGKGLSALISDDSIEDTQIEAVKQENGEIIRNINIELISPNQKQPRRDFDQQSLIDLSDSIKTHGLIQPIVVRQIEDKYEIIAGERRWRASKLALLKEIPCIIKEVDSEGSAKLALIENIQRENLNSIEEALAYKELMADYSLTQEDISKIIGKSRSYVANTLRLLNLDEKIIDLISNGKLTSGHGKALLSIKDKEEQLKVAEKIINTGMNVRDVESVVKEKKALPRIEKNSKEKESYIIDVEETLIRALGTKVTITKGDKKGKIEIEYYGEDDLERIIGYLIS